MSNKYKNRKIKVLGIVFDSQKEAARYKELLRRKQQGFISALELQKKFEICKKVKGEKGSRAKYYVCDFFYYDYALCKFVVEDVKGDYTARLPLFKLKWQLMKNLYPEYDFKIFN